MPYASINALLENDLTPEKLATLTDAQLNDLLSPYYPATRTPILPEEKPKKRTAEASLILDFIKNSDEVQAQIKARQSKTK